MVYAAIDTLDIIGHAAEEKNQIHRNIIKPRFLNKLQRLAFDVTRGIKELFRDGFNSCIKKLQILTHSSLKQPKTPNIDMMASRL